MKFALLTVLIVFLGLTSALPADELSILETRAKPSDEPIDVRYSSVNSRGLPAD